MGPISMIQRYIIGGASIALMFVAAWGVRVDHLRGKYLGDLEATAKVLQDHGLLGAKAKSNIPQVVTTLAQKATDLRQERDDARSLLDVQSNAYTVLKAQSDQYAAEAEANRKLAEQATRLRDVWIQRARTASTRTDRLSAEQELKQCEAVLDNLYSQGF